MQHLQPNTTLQGGKYRIERVLGQGGFGNTYVGVNTVFNERVAIKEFFMKGVTQRDDNQTTVSVSNSENIDSFQQQKEKFKKEARRIRQLKNEHIVAVHDLFEENGTAYYVMDYVDGENLEERLKRTGRPMTEQEVCDILPQILDALKSVHNEGFCHLDIKPSNIMLEKGGIVKLIDFGASKQLGTNGTLTTNAPTAFAQTPGFAPREQMEQNFNKIGPWTDIYALGATLYNLLTNKRPPLPTDIDDDTTEDKHIALQFHEDIGRIRHLILWMMNTNLKQRPQNIDAIIEVKKSKKEGTVHTPKQQPSAQNTTAADDESTIIAEPQPPKREKKSEPKPESESKAKPQVPDQPTSQGGNNGKDNNGYFIFARTAAAIIVVVTIVICILAGSYSNNDLNHGIPALDSSISSESNSTKSVQHNQTKSQSSKQINTATKTKESELVRLIANKVGKYPYEVGLTDNKEFSKRFSSLIGSKNYSSFKTNRLAESPIEVYDDSEKYLVSFWDKDEWCQYYIIYDKLKDNLTVIIQGNDVNSYAQEKTDKQLIETFSM